MEGLTLTGVLKRAAAEFPDHRAISVSGRMELTHAGLQSIVEEAAEVLVASGVRPGDVVALSFPNTVEFVVMFLAVIRARAVAAPLNPAYTREEFEFYLSDSESKLLLTNPEGNHAAQAAAAKLRLPHATASLPGTSIPINITSFRIISETEAERERRLAISDVSNESSDEALFLHTSGTTSRPKGVPLTQLNLVSSVHNIRSVYHLTESDSTVLVLPLFHVHGLLAGLLSSLSAAASVALPAAGRFSASTFWSDMRVHNATWYTAVPTIHQILLDRHAAKPEPAYPRLRFIRSCSAALAPVILEQLERAFHAPVLESYAMTEATHLMASNPLPENGPHKAGSVGRAVGQEMAILDEDGLPQPAHVNGEVCVRGPNVIKGYKNNPEANKAAFRFGWFHTGDLGFLDVDGYLHLVGRIKELINRGGEKISPMEVDEVLLSHPEVAQAVAFGVPDDKYGEEINCAVARFHGHLVVPHLGKMVGSIVKRLKDQDSVVREACVETVGLLASSLGSCGVSEGGGVFLVLAKPLFEALGEQNRYVQMGAAMCLARVIDDASDVPISILPQMLNRIIKLLKNPHFMAKPALVDLVRSIIQVGGASTVQALSLAMSSIQEALKSNDWTTRKTAAVSLLGIAANAGSMLVDLGPFKTSSIRSLECCRFDKVKPVRDAAVQALRCWKSLLESDCPEFSEADSSTKENFSGLDYPDTASASDGGGWKDTFFKKVALSALSGNTTSSTKRSPLSVRKTCQNYFQNRPHTRTNDWHIEVALPKDRSIPQVDSLPEESEGSCITKVYDRGNANGTTGQESKYDYDLLDEKLECSATSDRASVSFETKHVTAPHDSLEDGDQGSVNILKPNRRFAPNIIGNDICSVRVKECRMMDSTITERTPQGMCGCCLQSSDELSLIRKQLMDIESRQSSLMELLQAFTGNSMESLSLLQSKVHNLENKVDRIARDLAHSGNYNNLAGTKLLRKDHSATSSPRTSICSPRPSVDMKYRKTSMLSNKGREVWGNTLPSKSSSTSVKEIADPWVAKENQKSFGRCPQNSDISQNRKIKKSFSSYDARGQQNSSETKNATWKHIKDFIYAGDIESAFVEATAFGNDHVLIELMDRTGVVLECLSQETASKVLTALSMYILDQRYVDFVIPWLQQVVNFSTRKDADYFHLSKKSRREFLLAVQEALAMNFSDSLDRESIEQLAMHLSHLWCDVSTREVSSASALQGKRNLTMKTNE